MIHIFRRGRAPRGPALGVGLATGTGSEIQPLGSTCSGPGLCELYW